MATDSARRNYWQLPVFVLGVSAAVAAAEFTPPPPSDPAGSFRAALADLRAATDRKPPDAVVLETLARKTLDAVAAFPADANEAHYLVGSGFLIIADSGTGPAADYLTLAVRHFDQTDPAKLPGKDDVKKLAFRAAKAKAAAGTGDPALLLPVLGSPPADEDKVETARLIAETCLRQTPPDRKRARDELARYMALPNKATQAEAAKHKLTLADLSFQLNDPTQARRWLADIGANAPADQLAAAKVRLARLAAADNNWAEAAKLFEAAQVAGVPAAERALVRYQTGHALLKAENPTQAAAYLQEAARETGPVGAAAAIKLAELRVRDVSARGRRAEAADWLEKAAAGVTSAADFAPANVRPPEARAAFEEVIAKCLAESDFASAVRAATAYANVADAGKDKERRAEANAAWAASDKAVAAEKFKAAAADYVAAADASATGAGKTDFYRRAVGHFRTANDPAAAADALRKLIAVPDAPPDDLGFAYLTLADLLPPADYPGVRTALEKAMTLPGPTAASARFKMAMLHLNRGQALVAAGSEPGRQEGEAMARFGRQLLEQIADAGGVAPGEKAAHEEATFELARRLMGEQKYPDAEARFRKQIQLYPIGPLAGHGRLWLACCLLQQGNAAGPADPRLQETIDLLAPLRTSADAYLQTQADVRTLNTLIVQQKYDAAEAAGKELLAKFRGTADELVAAKLMFYGYIQRAKPDLGGAIGVLTRGEEAFAALPATAFPTDPEYTRDRWQKELAALRAEYAKRKQ